MRFFICLIASTLAAQVPYSRILNSAQEPQNWLTYSGNYSGQRYSPLNQVTTGNVNRLQVEWVLQTYTTESFETTPLVVDGVMYLTIGPNIVKAIDARTQAVFWTYTRRIPDDLRLCCGRVNRGVAILNDLVFYGSIDAHLIALDARTGKVVWDVELADYKLGYSSTGAPLAVKDKVITGMAGGEYGTRGFIDAYDARTGKRAWRFRTIPEPGEPGNDTWAGDSWKTGSATTWVTGSYDPESNTVYWGTGNPGPDWNGDVRLGDNLYSDSFLALDADTGERKWHFQFTPHDTHDWDSTHVPVLAEIPFRGAKRKVVLSANRNAFFYVLNRENGTFLHGKPYARQTWAKGLDDSGRPIVLPNTEPTVEGNLIWPSLAGATNWFSPAYNPVTNLFYAPVREQGAYYFKGEATFKPGAQFNGGGQRTNPDEEPYGAIRALDPESGNVRWEFKIHAPANAGILTTAGNLVFTGVQTDFVALDAGNGKLLWRFRTGGFINAAPITYRLDGKQYVAVAAGRGLFVFRLPE